MTSQSIADDITMTRELWHQHMKDDILLDIDYILGNIHGQSYKNTE